MSEHHSSFPDRHQLDSKPHNLSTNGNIKQASSFVNRMARRDPALYPLAFVIVGIFATTGYFAMKKAYEPDVERKFVNRVPPWEREELLGTAPGTTAQFKYRYPGRDGVMEDSFPTMNVEVRTLKPGTPTPKYTTTFESPTMKNMRKYEVDNAD